MNHPEYDITYVHRFYALTATAWLRVTTSFPTLFWIRQHHTFRLKQYCRSLSESKKIRTTLQESLYHTIRQWDNDKPHGVHLTSYNDCQILYWFKLFFHEHYYQHQYSPNQTLAEPNIMQDHSHTKPHHNAHVAKTEQIQNKYWKHVRSHHKKYTYLDVYVFHCRTREYRHQLREKENHSRNNTIPRHCFKCINHLGSHRIFPTTTRHVYVVLQITYAVLPCYTAEISFLLKMGYLLYFSQPHLTSHCSY